MGVACPYAALLYGCGLTRAMEIEQKARRGSKTC